MLVQNTVRMGDRQAAAHARWEAAHLDMRKAQIACFLAECAQLFAAHPGVHSFRFSQEISYNDNWNAFNLWLDEINGAAESQLFGEDYSEFEHEAIREGLREDFEHELKYAPEEEQRPERMHEEYLDDVTAVMTLLGRFLLDCGELFYRDAFGGSAVVTVTPVAVAVTFRDNTFDPTPAMTDALGIGVAAADGAALREVRLQSEAAVAAAEKEYRTAYREVFRARGADLFRAHPGLRSFSWCMRPSSTIWSLDGDLWDIRINDVPIDAFHILDQHARHDVLDAAARRDHYFARRYVGQRIVDADERGRSLTDADWFSATASAVASELLSFAGTDRGRWLAWVFGGTAAVTVERGDNPELATISVDHDRVWDRTGPASNAEDDRCREWEALGLGGMVVARPDAPFEDEAIRDACTSYLASRLARLFVTITGLISISWRQEGRGGNDAPQMLRDLRINGFGVAVPSAPIGNRANFTAWSAGEVAACRAVVPAEETYRAPNHAWFAESVRVVVDELADLLDCLTWPVLRELLGDDLVVEVRPVVVDGVRYAAIACVRAGMEGARQSSHNPGSR